MVDNQIRNRSFSLLQFKPQLLTECNSDLGEEFQIGWRRFKTSAVLHMKGVHARHTCMVNDISLQVLTQIMYEINKRTPSGLDLYTLLRNSTRTVVQVLELVPFERSHEACCLR